MKKYEKITLYTAIETWDDDPNSPKSRAASALDYIISELEGMAADLKILDYDTEDYKLVKITCDDNAKGGA